MKIVTINVLAPPNVCLLGSDAIASSCDVTVSRRGWGVREGERERLRERESLGRLSAARTGATAAKIEDGGAAGKQGEAVDYAPLPHPHPRSEQTPLPSLPDDDSLEFRMGATLSSPRPRPRRCSRPAASSSSS